MRPRRKAANGSAKITRAKQKFFEARARKGGIARSAYHSPLWRQLCMRFLTERRTKRTTTPTYREWLLERGFAGIADECRRPAADAAKK